MNKKLYIGIGGTARAGKDTFCAIAKKQLENQGLKVKKFALADELKNDLKDFIREKLDMDVYTQITSEKDIIRPILVGYGDSMRKKTHGTYWTDKLTKSISQDDSDVVIVTDIRYDEYQKDELYWMREQLGGVVVHVSKYELRENLYATQPDKIFIPPANDHEARNDPKIKSKANFVIEWEHQYGSILKSKYLNSIVSDILNKIQK